MQAETEALMTRSSEYNAESIEKQFNDRKHYQLNVKYYSLKWFLHSNNDILLSLYWYYSTDSHLQKWILSCQYFQADQWSYIKFNQ